MLIFSSKINWPAAWDFQQCGMSDQQSLRSACAYAQSDQSLCLSLEYSTSVKLLTEHHLEFLSFKWGCTGSSESTHVKMSHCWKSHVVAQFILANSADPGEMAHHTAFHLGLHYMFSQNMHFGVFGLQSILTFKAPIATKVVCFSHLIWVHTVDHRGFYEKQMRKADDCLLLYLNSSVMLGNYLQQTTSVYSIAWVECKSNWTISKHSEIFKKTITVAFSKMLNTRPYIYNDVCENALNLHNLFQFFEDEMNANKTELSNGNILVLCTFAPTNEIARAGNANDPC